MRAVRLFAPGDVRCVETEMPKVTGPDDVIVKVNACGSDIPRGAWNSSIAPLPVNEWETSLAAMAACRPSPSSRTAIASSIALNVSR